MYVTLNITCLLSFFLKNLDNNRGQTGKKNLHYDLTTPVNVKSDGLIMATLGIQQAKLTNIR